MKRAIALAALMLAACTDPKSAERALDDMAFKDITITGYRWLSCGEDYLYHTGFEAKNVNGKLVTGVVCSHFFKGSSVKLD